MKSFLKRNKFGVAFLVAFLISLFFVATASKENLPRAIFGSALILIPTTINFLMKKKFEKTYTSEQWDRAGEGFPRLLITEDVHSMGHYPIVTQVQQEFKKIISENGDVLILRDNDTINRFYKNHTIIIEKGSPPKNY